MIRGSCLCGEIQYHLKSEPKKASHCHCSMCQKQHGAAFATYISVPKNDLVYIKGRHLLTSYNSSGTVMRKFCSKCGSSLEWSGSKKYPEWASIALSTLDSKFEPQNISNIYTETKVCWLERS